VNRTLILAMNYHQAISFLRHFKLNPQNFRYVVDYDDLCGRHWGTPVILLEGYHLNKNYTLGLMTYLEYRFNDIGFISEGEIWENEEVPIQYCY
jgi:hypothetical protein